MSTKRMGRPPKDNGYDAVITIPCHKEMLDVVDSRASSSNMSRAEFGRMALAQLLAMKGIVKPSRKGPKR